MKKFCPLTKSDCREDCGWRVIIKDLDINGCALFVLAEEANATSCATRDIFLNLDETNEGIKQVTKEINKVVQVIEEK